MNPVLKLIRPLNCIMGAVGVFIGALIGIGSDIFDPNFYGQIILATVVAFLFMASGNIMNDYFDRDIDKINHPDRPIPMGQVSSESALYISISIFIFVTILAFFINFYALVIAIIALALMLGYEISLKNRGFIGNISISALVALLFLFGGAAVNQIGTVFILALLAFFATLSREIVKDIEDLKGDVTRDTVPKKIGLRNAGIIASIALIIAIFLSPLPILPELIPFLEIKQFNMYYFYIVIIADIIFGSAVLNIFKNPHLAQNTLKLGMICALVAFVIGSIL